MYKLKYYSLKKEKRKEITNEFYNTDFGKSIKERLTRLNIIGILAILFSIYLIISGSSKWEIVYGIILTIAGIIFIIGSYKVKIDKINTYLINKK